MSTVFGILFLVAIFGVPLYTVGRITCFLTSELKSKMARRLWLALTVCTTAALMVFGMSGEMQKLSRSLYDVLGSLFLASFVYFVIDIFWRLLHWLTGERYTPLVNELGAAAGGPVNYLDEAKQRDDDSLFENGFQAGPFGPGIYVGGVRIDSDSNLHIDHSSSFDHRW
ncbi:hypothetical protein [Thiobacter aerophilum]|uniref:Uncharacterized protein n=1 Tax=Thiobacter aerophilum TaxID=3121275 RepID=A0ABV0EIL3_9BURK